jgi:heme/copper-type cytochrome/quinol oxidase subunit 4
METAVFALCALTSIACATLLLRGYARSRARLLLWSGLCFVGLALNNVLLFVDMRVVSQTDLSVWRTLPALFGLVVLVYGLVWESR